ncbi:MAG: hypothetical protein GY697_00420, partial [Desulfobacterales bacterium]|nr:hypothetical protein [Desulfobacterales bacterium]
RDAYKKLKNELGKSGAPRRKLSEHQDWLLRRFRFYDAVIRSDAVVSQPLKNLSRQPEEVESEEDQEGGSQDLEAMEHDAALVSTSNPDTSQPPKKKSKKTTKEEDGQALLRECRDSIKSCTEIIKTFAPRPPPTDRAAFINYVTESLKTMDDEQYQNAIPRITSLIQEHPPQAFPPRPAQVHSAPLPQVQHQDAQQQFMCPPPPTPAPGFAPIHHRTPPSYH